MVEYRALTTEAAEIWRLEQTLTMKVAAGGERLRGNKKAEQIMKRGT